MNESLQRMLFRGLQSSAFLNLEHVYFILCIPSGNFDRWGALIFEPAQGRTRSRKGSQRNLKCYGHLELGPASPYRLSIQAMPRVRMGTPAAEATV